MWILKECYPDNFKPTDVYKNTNISTGQKNKD